MKTPYVPIALACGLALLSFGTALAADSTRGDAVTFNEHVATIMHERCASCHRPDQAAPFSLLTYEDAAKRAQSDPRRHWHRLHAAVARRSRATASSRANGG